MIACVEHIPLLIQIGLGCLCFAATLLFIGLAVSFMRDFR